VAWTDVSEEHQLELIEKAITDCTDDPKYSVLHSTFRHKYMVERIMRISKRSVSVLTNHLKAGKFSPLGAEISFSSVSNLESLKFKLSDDEIMKLRGTIDRIDVYDAGAGDDLSNNASEENELEDDTVNDKVSNENSNNNNANDVNTKNEDAHNDRVYIKVIDYKSGNKSLDLVEVYKGLSLQLVVYMNVAMELAKGKSEYAGKDVIPAGILYYHIDDPMVEGNASESQEDIEKKIYKELKMKGLVNEDDEIYKLIDSKMESASSIIPVSVTKGGDISKLSSTLTTDGFNVVSSYVNEKIKNIGKDILSGNIKPEPHTAGGVDYAGCAYCPYTDICKFDGTYTVDELETVVTKDNVLDEMRREINGINRNNEEHGDENGDENGVDANKDVEKGIGTARGGVQ